MRISHSNMRNIFQFPISHSNLAFQYAKIRKKHAVYIRIRRIYTYTPNIYVTFNTAHVYKSINNVSIGDTHRTLPCIRQIPRSTYYVRRILYAVYTAYVIRYTSIRPTLLNTLLFVIVPRCMVTDKYVFGQHFTEVIALVQP
jgi:hypothetical protein